ncbi:MAG: 30S ribosomal protein S17 [Candidatus Marinimicrobia bacterium]|jgi:small subunit ribosomal protein S17|nr:30S ribosomal protein S17 [Candidatus Neomarinimicrobiota bacterium]MDP6456052.1 30S ribosomal protein S17 [Candidatus Neomarinimicrobiota bacterium]MDP6592651.1 30S ribosomal protein S17 [Candidatus Neomarinimicrobiota bacterium]MDP6836497.1 30S ribosomal protein S17 [Candidatus Neomarinimicrobiota bacterium]MDP6966455.1 30S ribosomal protein S17 [Candidatus Neomarinimicrobiota bacterium]|tara:strand:+ start:396 stop:659 length:264 start_codon:yes stop_codon:yes gene_type:complete
MTDRGKRQVLVGTVISDKMQKTVLVEVARRVQHPVYKKYITKKKKVSAHVENKECQPGDQVRIISSRPLSKTKHWRVSEIVRKGTGE